MNAKGTKKKARVITADECEFSLQTCSAGADRTLFRNLLPDAK
jgi:hypothetical protein